MATLTNSDYSEIQDSIYQAGADKEELKALSDGLPSTTRKSTTFWLRG